MTIHRFYFSLEHLVTITGYFFEIIILTVNIYSTILIRPFSDECLHDPNVTILK